MKFFLDHFERFWVSLAFLLSRAPISLIVVCVAVGICFVPGSFNRLYMIEKMVAYAAAKYSGISERPSEVAIISVDDELMETWQSDLYQADKLALLVANILHSSDSTTGLLTDRPVSLTADTLEQTVDAASDQNDEVNELVRQRRDLIKLLRDPRVVLGVKGHVSQKSAIFEQQAYGDFETAAIKLNEAVGRCAECDNVEITDTHVFGLGELGSGFSRFWFERENRFYPTYVAGLCGSRRFHVTKHAELPITISPLESISHAFGCFSSPSIPLRSFVSAYDVLSGYSARTIVLNVEEALALSTFPELVLIASASDKALNMKIANVVHGLKHQQFLVVPWWAELVLKATFILFVLISIFLKSKIHIRYSCLVFLGTTIVASIAVSISIAFAHQLLIPISQLVLFCLFTYMAFSLRNIVLRDHNSRKQQLASAIDNSLEFLDAHRAYDEAINLLEHHPDEQKAISKITEICDILAKSPDTLTQAIHVMESLHPKYRNNKQLIDKLTSFKSDLSRTRTLQTAESKQPSTRATLPEKLGRYEVERELGRGAVGVVYLGYDPAISRHVAIKTLDTKAFSEEQVNDLKQRFFREAEAAGRLSHPNIVSVYDVGEEKELAFIAMDYVEGVPLSHHVVEENLLPISEVYRVVHDVACALSYAHEHHIIHRDIKPGNIMYGANPRAVKVADFGIARLLDHSRTATGEILGSPLYMSPEQLQGSKVDATADIFSVGVTFYQLLTGHLPFDAVNLAGLTYEIIHTKHKNIRSIRKELPASAARIVNQCLQKSPIDRYQTAHELVAVLRKAIKRDFPDTAKQIAVI